MNEASSGALFKGFDLRTGFLNALLILPPAFLYSMKTDLPHILLIAAAMLGTGLFRRSYLSYSDRPIIYCVTAALVLTIVPDMVVTVDESRFGLFDLMLRSSLAVPLLLYLAALSCLFPPNQHRAGLSAALAVAATLICGDIFNSADQTNTVLSFLDVPLRNYRTSYTIAVIVQAMTLPFFFYTTTRTVYPEKKCRSTSILRSAVRFLCIVLIPVFALSLSEFYYAHTALFRNLEFYFLRLGMRRPARGNEMMILSNSVNLNATMQSELLKNPDKVLLRAKADAPPGYLRGGVYTMYRRGEWLSNPVRTNLSAMRRATILSENTFTVPDYPDAPATVPDDPREPPPEPIRRVELYFEGLLTRGVIPAPGNTYRIDAVADDAQITDSGVFSLKLWKRDGGCTVFTSNYDPAAAYPMPVPEEAHFLTELPRPLRRPFGKIAGEALSGRKIRRDRDRVAAVIEFLSRYSYSLSFRPPGERGDPVLHFLTKERRGHCELFASAAVLLLRSMGLPARYVTGLVCEELHPYSQYYIARASNVHAWGEVYLRDEKCWMLVEATPPSGDLPSARSIRKQSVFSSVMDLLQQTFRNAFADIRRGYFANAVLTVLEIAFALLLRVFFHPAALLVLIPAGFVVWFRYFRRKGRVRAGGVLGDREKKRLSSAFATFERGYAANAHRKRAQGETLSHYYASAPQEIREYVAQYESLRYREQSPAPEIVREMAHRGRLLLKKRSGR